MAASRPIGRRRTPRLNVLLRCVYWSSFQSDCGSYYFGETITWYIRIIPTDEYPAYSYDRTRSKQLELRGNFSLYICDKKRHLRATTTIDELIACTAHRAAQDQRSRAIVQRRASCTSRSRSCAARGRQLEIIRCRQHTFRGICVVAVFSPYTSTRISRARILIFVILFCTRIDVSGFWWMCYSSVIIPIGFFALCLLVWWKYLSTFQSVEWTTCWLTRIGGIGLFAKTIWWLFFQAPIYIYIYIVGLPNALQRLQVRKAFRYFYKMWLHNLLFEKENEKCKSIPFSNTHFSN